VGFTPDLSDSNGDDFQRSQLSRLGKESRADTNIEGFRIEKISIEDSKPRERNGWQALPLGHRDYGTDRLLIRYGGV